MNHVAGVEVVEAISDVGELEMEVGVGQKQQNINLRVQAGLCQGSS